MVGVMRVTQAVPTGTELHGVVHAVLAGALRASSAQRMVLVLLNYRGELRAWDTLDDRAAAPGGLPFDELGDVPRTILRHVMHTRVTLRIDGRDATQFSGDPYVQAARPASLACAPLLLAGELQGILYLEHRESLDAFDPACLERVGFITEMAAVAARAERLKAEFVATVSHELRTPLTAIRGALGLLAGGVGGPLSPAAAELAGVASMNSERLARLVDDVLDLERCERGELALRLEELPLVDALRRAIDTCRGDALQHGVELVLEAGEEAADARVNADADRLGQVLAHLIANAVQFSGTGSRVVIRASRSPGAIRVEVRDHGSGVPVEFRARLFRCFAQADGTDARSHGGLGLGLSITRELVRRMGGTIGYEPIAPAGSCFYFELPRP